MSPDSVGAGLQGTPKKRSAFFWGPRSHPYKTRDTVIVPAAASADLDSTTYICIYKRRETRVDHVVRGGLRGCQPMGMRNFSQPSVCSSGMKKKMKRICAIIRLISETRDG